MKSRVVALCLFVVVIILNISGEVSSTSGIDIPFQFFGLPFVITLVRIIQFLRQLSYIFSPGKIVFIIITRETSRQCAGNSSHRSDLKAGSYFCRRISFFYSNGNHDLLYYIIFFSISMCVVVLLLVQLVNFKLCVGLYYNCRCM